MTIAAYDEVSIDMPSDIDTTGTTNKPDDVADDQSCDIRWGRIMKDIIIIFIVLTYLFAPGIIIGLLNISYDIQIWATLLIAFSPFELILVL